MGKGKKPITKKMLSNRVEFGKELTPTSKQIINFLNKYNKEAMAAGRKNKPISDNKLQHTKDFLNIAEAQVYSVRDALKVMKDFPQSVQNAFKRKFNK